MKSRSEVEALERLIGQLHGLHSEISVLVKKSPSDAVNAFKLRLINNVIYAANDVLGPNYLPFGDFESFDVDDVPSTSDVALVLAQYMEEAERYRSDNVKSWQGGSTSSTVTPVTFDLVCQPRSGRNDRLRTCNDRRCRQNL